MENCMEKMIEILYKANMEQFSYAFARQDTEAMKREWALYEQLQENLTKEQKTDFQEYTNLCAERHSVERRAAYEQGFKAAIRLLLEATKD